MNGEKISKMHFLVQNAKRQKVGLSHKGRFDLIGPATEGQISVLITRYITEFDESYYELREKMGVMGEREHKLRHFVLVYYEPTAGFFRYWQLKDLVTMENLDENLYLLINKAGHFS